MCVFCALSFLALGLTITDTNSFFLSVSPKNQCVLKRDFFVRSFQILPSLSDKMETKLEGFAANARNKFLKREAQALLKQNSPASKKQKK